MAAAGTWVNPDGLVQKFANYYKNPSNFVNVPRALPSKGGLVKEIVIDYDLAQLSASGGVSYTTDLTNNGVVDGFNTGDTALPAYSNVLRVTLIAKEAAAGGTSLALGTFTLAGVAIDADGLITDTEGVIANMNAIGERVNGAGAQVVLTSNAGVSVGAADAFLALTATGTFTAGKGRILVEYIDPLGDTA